MENEAGRLLTAPRSIHDTSLSRETLGSLHPAEIPSREALMAEGDHANINGLPWGNGSAGEIESAMIILVDDGEPTALQRFPRSASELHAVSETRKVRIETRVTHIGGSRVVVTENADLGLEWGSRILT